MSRSSQRKKRESVSLPIEIKPLSETEESELRRGLLRSDELMAIKEAESGSKRMSLLKKKMRLCLVSCDWNKKEDEMESQLIANKRRCLLEILEYFGQRKFKSLDLLKHCMRLIWLNLFRALPDHLAMRTHPNDDEMDFREPSWDHLVLIYEISFHVVTNTEIDKKTMQKQLRGNFLTLLISLFSSLDDREPQYVKIILHAIYGRFMALRRDIRQILSNFCFAYIYESKLELNDSNTSIVWQGIPEILAIFCSIIQGLNVPVKDDYHSLLRNVLIPLHKTYHIDAFHEELIQCLTQFILKDPHSLSLILGGMLRFWPTVSPLKEQLFIDEVVHLLNACSDYIEQIGCVKAKCYATGDTLNCHEQQFEDMLVAIIHKLCKSMFCDHHQVSERALLVFKEDSIKLCLEVFGDKCWSAVYSTLKRVTDKYWLSDIRQIAKSVISNLQSTNPEFFKSSTVSKCHKIQRRLRSAQKSKKRQREGRWQKVRQLAISQINR